MQNRWLQTRRHFYEVLKKQVELILGPPSESLRKYEVHFQKHFEKIWEVSALEELMNEVKHATFVLGGDFHSFSQSQRAHLRVLRQLKKQTKRPIILALEVFDIMDQAGLDAFVEGKISFEDLLVKTDWAFYWPGIPVYGYELLLKWAKKNKVQVCGINKATESSLKLRDEISAQALQKLHEQNPDAIIYTLYGEFHLADTHIPKQLKSYKAKKDLRIFLNADELYFTLAEHAVEDRFDVLRLEDKFCILSSPPWVKWQSYLLSLQEVDDEFISDHYDWDEDFTEYVAQILNLMVKDFDYEDLSSQLSVYTSSEMDLEYIYDLNLRESDLEKIEHLISTEKNILFPRHGLQYLGRTTVNQAATLAGEIFHAHISGRKKFIWDSSLSFEAKVWMEAVNFFLSLTINPKRKAIGEKDLRTQLEAQGEKSYAIEVLELALDFRLSVMKAAQGEGPRELLTALPSDWKVQLESSVILGEIMGQRLYTAFRQGEIERDTLMSYLSLPVDSPKFKSMFDFLSTKLEK